MLNKHFKYQIYFLMSIRHAAMMAQGEDDLKPGASSEADDLKALL